MERTVIGILEVVWVGSDPNLGGSGGMLPQKNFDISGVQRCIFGTFRYLRRSW